MVARAVNFFEVGDALLVAFVLRIFQQNLAVSDDGIERRAQFVAHLGQKIGLGRTGTFGFFGRKAQFRRCRHMLAHLVFNFAL